MKKIPDELLGAEAVNPDLFLYTPIAKPLDIDFECDWLKKAYPKFRPFPSVGKDIIILEALDIPNLSYELPVSELPMLKFEMLARNTENDLEKYMANADYHGALSRLQKFFSAVNVYSGAYPAAADWIFKKATEAVNTLHESISDISVALHVYQWFWCCDLSAFCQAT